MAGEVFTYLYRISLRHYPDRQLDSPLMVVLDGNKIKPAAVQLKKAGIVQSLEIELMDYHTLHAALYSDGATLYFYNAVRSMDAKLQAAIDYPHETAFSYVELPLLSA